MANIPPLRLQERKTLSLLLILALLVRLSNFLFGKLVVATLLLEAATVVRVGCRVNVEESVHLAIGSVGRVVAIC